MNLLKKTFFLALVACVFSCSQTNTPEPLPAQEAPRISVQRYYFSDLSFGTINFHYDDNGSLLEKQWFNPQNEMDFNEKFLYEHEKLIRIDRVLTNGKFAEARFAYENDQLQSLEYWLEDSNGILKRHYTIRYEYNNDQLVKSIEIPMHGTPSVYCLYTYNGENIASIKTFDYASNVQTSESYYEYDDKPNPFYQQSVQYLGYPQTSSKNNLLHEWSVYAGSNEQRYESYYDYTYGENGYRTEMYIIGEDGKRYLDASYTYTN